jgi:hypothetical protein
MDNELVDRRAPDMRGNFSSRDRRVLLDQVLSLKKRRDEMELEAAEKGSLYLAEHETEADHVTGMIRDLSAEYSRKVQRVPVSRCPFSGELVVHSLDTFGIDGLWWDSEAPVRPSETLPGSFFALTGAMALAGNVEYTPFLVRPGPGVPFVIPWIITHPAIHAVLFTVRIGPHTGYPVCYFCSSGGDLPARPSPWGATEWSGEASPGRYGWSSRETAMSEMDFDIGRWIQKGKLSWIAPGDTGFTLQDRIEGCPYRDVTGGTATVTVFEGRVIFDRPE